MGRSGILRDLTGIWAPGMLCVAAIAWLTIGRRRALPDRSKLIWALILFTLLSQIPVLARPLSQIGTSMPPAIILFVILADVLLRGGRGAMAASAAGLALACFYGFAVLDPMIFALRTKYIYVGYPKSQAGIPLERLGTVKLRRAQAKETMELVEEIRKLCPPGGRVYLAAHWHSHLIFLADRAALGPYALTYLAATESQRRDVVAALEKARPPAALAARRGIDLDFAVEHPEEWEWLQANYRPLRTVGEVTIWAPK